jgi:hypothetical protein
MERPDSTEQAFAVRDLRDTRGAAVGGMHLRKLKDLRVVWLEETRVTPTGRAELQKALPNARIHYR